METNNLKRDPVKYLRDYMKSKYKDKEPCFVCGSTDNIELHHIYSVAELWNVWVTKNSIKVISVEDITKHRVTFEEDNREKLSNDNLYSLCKTHHAKLHQIYGKSYSNYMGEKVRLWLQKQKERFGDKQK